MSRRVSVQKHTTVLSHHWLSRSRPRRKPCRARVWRLNPANRAAGNAKNMHLGQSSRPSHDNARPFLVIFHQGQQTSDPTKLTRHDALDVQDWARSTVRVIRTPGFFTCVMVRAGFGQGTARASSPSFSQLREMTPSVGGRREIIVIIVISLAGTSCQYIEY